MQRLILFFEIIALSLLKYIEITFDYQVLPDCESKDPANLACTGCIDATGISKCICVSVGTRGICQCSKGNYLKLVKQECRPCDYNCETCFSKPNFCKACPNISPTCDCLDNFQENGIDKMCFQCHYSCKTCSGPAENNCLQCDEQNSRQISAGNKCICKDGFFQNGNNKQCSQCHQNCKTCSGPNISDCILCFDGPKIKRSDSSSLTSSCICIEGYFLNASNQCVQCFSNCKTCVGLTQNDCVLCDSNKQFKRSDESKSTSSCECQEGYYEYNFQCIQCNPKCKTCSGTSENDCISCNTNSKRSDTSQLKSSCVCEEGYFEDQNKCIQCHSSCKTCTSPNNTDCITCNSNYERQNANSLVSSCVCKKGFYEVQNKQCLQCDQKCESCSGPSDSECILCRTNEGYERSNKLNLVSTCICMEGYLENQNKKCSKCFPNCQTCNGVTQNDCILCDSKKQYKRSDESNQKPTSSCECKEGYYENNLQCIQCNPKCKTCSGTSENDCISCNTNSKRSDTSQLNSSCVCEEGYFEDQNKCIQCHSSCKTCTSPNNTDCITCNSNYERQNANSLVSSCVCKKGYYEDSNIKCIQCDQKCESCSGPSDSECILCKTNEGYERSNKLNLVSSCICMEGFLEDQNKKCSKCFPNCQTCDGITNNNCVLCDSKKQYKRSDESNLKPSSSCECNEGYYENNFQCIQCNPKCKTCSGTSQNDCISCYTNSKRSDTSQLKSSCVCEEGYIEAQNKCVQCYTSCKTCTSPNNTDCIVCNTNYERQNVNSLVSSCVCKKGYYEDSNIKCIQCDQKCESCSGPSDSECILCKTNEGYERSNKLNLVSSCICMEGYQEDQNKKCSKCFPNCQTCVGLTQNDCVLCDSKKQYKRSDETNQKPTSSCECNEGYYENHFQCIQCNPKCKTCSGSSENDCISCYTNNKQKRSDETQLKSSCVCEEGYFEDQNKCVQCHQSCKTCTSPNDTDCIVCNSNYERQNLNTPLSSCACKKEYQGNSNKQCLQCDQKCEQCSGPSDSECILCKTNEGYERSNKLNPVSTCICMEGYLEVQNKKCSKCFPNCQTCDGITKNNCVLCDSKKQYKRSDESNSKPTSSCECKEGYYENNFQCIQCNPKCKTCSGTSENDCISCYTNNKQKRSDESQLKSSCVCEEDYFEAQNKCVKCHTSCKTCTSSNNTDCIVCNTNYERQNANSLVSSCVCKQGFYEVQNKQCLQCDQKCESCSGPSDSECILCKTNEGYERSNKSNPVSTCICMEGYLEDQNKKCSKCFPNCQTCVGLTQNDCVLCDSKKQYKRSNQSKSTSSCECKEGYYENNFQCIQCNPKCKTCSGTSENDCISCYTNNKQKRSDESQLKSSCVCEENYFEAQNKCVKCHTSCKTCTSSNNTDCIVCNSNYERQNINSLVSSCVCKKGFYEDSNIKCIQCDQKCESCSGPSDSECILCKTNEGYERSNKSNPVSSCICMEGYLEDQNKKCPKCFPNCQTCNGLTQNDCVLCDSKKQYKRSDESNSKPTSSCECKEGYYQNNFQCKQCYLNCKTCSGTQQNDCISCYTNSKRSDTSSLKSSCVCEEGYFEVQNKCVQCHSSCKTCSGPSINECILCHSNLKYQRFNNQNSSSSCICMEGYYQDPLQKCQLCNKNCKTCSGPESSQCILCHTNQYKDRLNKQIQTSSCVCMQGYFEDKNQQCIQCNQKCESCAGPNINECILCKIDQNYERSNKQDLISSCTCIKEYYEVENSCVKNHCNEKCAVCSPEGRNCLQCQIKYIKDEETQECIQTITEIKDDYVVSESIAYKVTSYTAVSTSITSTLISASLTNKEISKQLITLQKLNLIQLINILYIEELFTVLEALRGVNPLDKIKNIDFISIFIFNEHGQKLDKQIISKKVGQTSLISNAGGSLLCILVCAITITPLLYLKIFSMENTDNEDIEVIPLKEKMITMYKTISCHLFVQLNDVIQYITPLSVYLQIINIIENGISVYIIGIKMTITLVLFSYNLVIYIFYFYTLNYPSNYNQNTSQRTSRTYQQVLYTILLSENIEQNKKTRNFKFMYQISENLLFPMVIVFFYKDFRLQCSIGILQQSMFLILSIVLRPSQYALNNLAMIIEQTFWILSLILLLVVGIKTEYLFAHPELKEDILPTIERLSYIIIGCIYVLLLINPLIQLIKIVILLIPYVQKLMQKLEQRKYQQKQQQIVCELQNSLVYNSLQKEQTKLVMSIKPIIQLKKLNANKKLNNYYSFNEKDSQSIIQYDELDEVSETENQQQSNLL